VSTPFENPFEEYPDVRIELPPPVYDYLQKHADVARKAMETITADLTEICGNDSILKGVLCRMLADSYEALLRHEQRKIHRSN
jgi:hypothetical protein